MNYGYVRVSTRGQMDGNSVEDQTLVITKEYPDAEIIVESCSGAKERPLFTKLVARCKEGDKLIVTKLDRFCRTTKDGLEYIDTLKSKGVKVHILNMGLIEDTPMGDLIITCLLAFAQFEREQIIERTRAGKAIAKKNPDFREGRPRKFTHQQIEHALELLEENSYKQVALMTGISVSTLVRAKRLRTDQSSYIR